MLFDISTQEMMQMIEEVGCAPSFTGFSQLPDELFSTENNVSDVVPAKPTKSLSRRGAKRKSAEATDDDFVGTPKTLDSKVSSGGNKPPKVKEIPAKKNQKSTANEKKKAPPKKTTKTSVVSNIKEAMPSTSKQALANLDVASTGNSKKSTQSTLCQYTQTKNAFKGNHECGDQCNTTVSNSSKVDEVSEPEILELDLTEPENNEKIIPKRRKYDRRRIKSNIPFQQDLEFAQVSYPGYGAAIMLHGVVDGTTLCLSYKMLNKIMENCK